MLKSFAMASDIKLGHMQVLIGLSSRVARRATRGPYTDYRAFETWIPDVVP